jgi:hypothetical protein
MKKGFMLLVVLLSCITFSNAQVSLIPKGGVNVANVTFDGDKDGADDYIGLNLGMGLNFSVTPDNFFSIQPELLFSQKGYRVANDVSNYRNIYNYLEMPVLAKISFGGEKVKAYVNAGPHIGYMINNTVRGVFSEDDFDTDFDGNKFEYGLNFGGGLGLGPVLFDVRYTGGLNDTEIGFKSKNHVVGMTVGFQIPLSR